MKKHKKNKDRLQSVSDPLKDESEPLSRERRARTLTRFLRALDHERGSFAELVPFSLQEKYKALKGIVADVNSESVIVDLSYNVQGIIPVTDFWKDGEKVKPGDTVMVWLEAPPDREGGYWHLYRLQPKPEETPKAAESGEEAPKATKDLLSLVHGSQPVKPEKTHRKRGDGKG